MNEKFKTYLVGAFVPYKGFADWRDFVRKVVPNENVEFIDPRYNSNQLCPASFYIR